MKHLLEVLSMGRLQALEQLHWVPCVRYDPDAPILSIIAENHAGLRTISLDMALDDFAERFEGYESDERDERTKLAVALAKFCVVDLTHCVCEKTDATRFLRALLKASCGAISNLKALVMRWTMLMLWLRKGYKLWQLLWCQLQMMQVSSSL